MKSAYFWLVHTELLISVTSFVGLSYRQKRITKYKQGTIIHTHGSYEHRSTSTLPDSITAWAHLDSCYWSSPQTVALTSNKHISQSVRLLVRDRLCLEWKSCFDSKVLMVVLHHVKRQASVTLQVWCVTDSLHPLSCNTHAVILLLFLHVSAHMRPAAAPLIRPALSSSIAELCSRLMRFWGAWSAEHVCENYRDRN